MTSSTTATGPDAGGAPPPVRRIIGYYAGWTRDTKGFSPADIPAASLTHVNYAFGLIADGRAVLGDPAADIGRPALATDQDPAPLAGNFQQLRELKRRHPHLKTLISLGGWTGSVGFSDAVATEQERREFVASCVELFLTRWPGVFDGIDIDWEYPVCCGLPDNGYRPEDKRNCTLLFAELRRQLDELGATTGERYLLTAAIPAGRKLPTTCFELRQIAEILDWINVMTYDISGSGESGVTNFNAAFRPSEDDPSPPEIRAHHNVVGTIEVFEAAGVPRHQLVVGVPFYGRGFTGVAAANDGLYQPFTGTMSADYRTIQSEYLPTGRTYRHPEAGVPWHFDPESGRMISYDDPESIGVKADYVRDHGLGGMMIWELSGDDDQGSLLATIASRLGR